jgi:hypothetical protein
MHQNEPAMWLGLGLRIGGGIALAASSGLVSAVRRRRGVNSRLRDDNCRYPQALTN